MASGKKRADVRHEDDRKFAVGELLELTRTDQLGVPTQPETRLLVAITHIDRFAGPHELFGQRPADEGTCYPTVPIAVLSFDPAVRQYEAPAPAALVAGGSKAP
jgi:hypothetical protein